MSRSGAYLLSVIPAHGLWVDANFKEDQLARMQPGQPATVVADVLPGKVFHGHVQSLAPATGRGVQRDPAGKRHRQFHQDRAARAGAHRARRRRRNARRIASGAFDDGQRRYAAGAAAGE